MNRAYLSKVVGVLNRQSVRSDKWEKIVREFVYTIQPAFPGGIETAFKPNALAKAVVDSIVVQHLRTR